jgi:uncharacterized membrane protein YccC
MVSMAIVAVYLFAVLPRISNIEILIVTLAPTLLVFGVLIARPSTAFIGMALAANIVSLMALQSVYSADLRPLPIPRWRSWLGRRWRWWSPDWRGLSAPNGVQGALIGAVLRPGAFAAERRGKRDRAAFAGVMLNRLGLLAPRLAAIPESYLRQVDGLSELRVGLNIVDLRRARHGLTSRTLRAMDDMLDRLAAAFRGHDGGPMSPELLRSIDAALLKPLPGPATA